MAVEEVKFESVRSLMCDGDGTLSPWALDATIVADAVRRLKQYGGLKKDVTPESVVAASQMER